MNCNRHLVFGYKVKEKYSVYALKNIFRKHVDLLLIGEEDERDRVLIKDFNTFKYDHTLYREQKYFCRYFLQAFSAAEI